MSYKIPQLGLRMIKERTLTLASQTATNSNDVAAVAHKLIGNRPIEHLIAIMVDGQANITAVATISQGGMHGMGCRPADVLRAVLASHASAFILSHNHPSGDPNPSPEDVAFTKAIEHAAKIVGIPLPDHVIVTRHPDRFRSVS